MIGIFDSGLGGLAILKEIRQVLPDYDYLYYGDTLHVPYGNRSPEAILELTKKACDYLLANDCRLIILACNTASAKALRQLQQEYLPKKRNELGPCNILGVIRPLAEEIAKLNLKKVGIIGTRATVNSQTYVLELNKLRQGKNLPNFEIYQVATPLLVPFIEEGLIYRPELKRIIRYYLRDLKRQKPEALILGCTHYPLIASQIQGVIGQNVYTPNPGQIVAKSLKDYLARHQELDQLLSQQKKIKFVVTDNNENYRRMAQSFWPGKIKLEILERST